jgi:hypothetical protein
MQALRAADCSVSFSENHSSLEPDGIFSKADTDITEGFSNLGERVGRLGL